MSIYLSIVCSTIFSAAYIHYLLYSTLIFVYFFVLFLIFADPRSEMSTPKKSAFDVLMNKTNKIKELSESSKKTVKIENRIDNDDIIVIRDIKYPSLKPSVVEQKPDENPNREEYFDENFFQHTHQYLG